MASEASGFARADCRCLCGQGSLWERPCRDRALSAPSEARRRLTRAKPQLLFAIEAATSALGGAAGRGGSAFPGAALSTGAKARSDTGILPERPFDECGQLKRDGNDRLRGDGDARRRNGGKAN